MKGNKGVKKEERIKMSSKNSRNDRSQVNLGNVQIKGIWDMNWKSSDSIISPLRYRSRLPRWNTRYLGRIRILQYPHPCSGTCRSRNSPGCPGSPRRWSRGWKQMTRLVSKKTPEQIPGLEKEPTSVMLMSLNGCCWFWSSGGCWTSGWGAGADVGCCAAAVVAFAPVLLNELGCWGVIGVGGVGVGGCSASEDGVAAVFALAAAAAACFFGR